MAEWLEPMKATLEHEPFFEPGWIYERKLDGIRILAYRQDNEVHLYTRNRKERDQTYPEITEALRKQEGEWILDGEIVALDGDITSFQMLQKRIGISDADRSRDTGVDVYYYVFDILSLDGKNLAGMGLLERKEILKRSLDFADPIRYLDHRTDGKKYYKDACRKGWEGLIAKKSDSAYVHARSKKWLKFKCQRGQEFVIGGYTDPKGNRIGFGALLIGYYENGNLRYAGKVGTGYSDRFLREFERKLKENERATNPFFNPIDQGNAHFVVPKFIAQIRFTEWTSEGKLRHPTFLGLRCDKDAKEIVRES